MSIAAAQLGAVAAALGAAIAEQQAAVAAIEAHAARHSYGGAGGTSSADRDPDGGIATGRALALAAEVRRLDVQARALLAAARGG